MSNSHGDSLNNTLQRFFCGRKAHFNDHKGNPFFLVFVFCFFFCLAWNAFPDFGLVILGIGGPVGPLGVRPY